MLLFPSANGILSPINVLIPGGGVPVFIPSSGSIADNGALTLTTALPVTFPSIYLYFPANAIVAGSAAGLYYCVMSSTTVGTIYNNTYTSGTPTIPSSPTAFVTTGPGAYTQTTAADINLITTTIPATAMGNSGSLNVRTLSSFPNNGNLKTHKYKFGGSTFFSSNPSSITLDCLKTVSNCGVTNRQVIYLSTSPINTPSTTAPTFLAIDTLSDVAVNITGQLQVATDYIGYYYYSMEIR